MPSLAEKLKSLGVKIGAEINPPAPKIKNEVGIEEVVNGRWAQTRLGDAFIGENIYPLDYRHGVLPLTSNAILENLSVWNNDERIRAMPLEKFAFLDTETSGLAGGTGTFAFLIGVGRFINNEYQVAQFFMRDPSEEGALLEALINFLAPCEALVTFNGKAFDAPILSTRYTLHSIPNPFKNFAHVDLLPLARRLWRDRLESRALKYLEEHVMFAPRSVDEVPGGEIPFLYFDYLNTRDARFLKGVFYHNAMDIVAMTALFTHCATLLANPHDVEIEHSLDVFALAKLFEDLGKWDDAARLYERSLESGLPPSGFAEALKRLALLERRRGDMETALHLWERAAEQNHIYAHVELAKYHEHKMKDVKSALKWTKSALKLANKKDVPAHIQSYWVEELTHRLVRLEKKFVNGK